MRNWKEIVNERYYRPNEVLPGGKTPNQKNKKKSKEFLKSNEKYKSPSYDDDGTMETGTERASRLRKSYEASKILRKASKRKDNNLSPADLELRKRLQKTREDSEKRKKEYIDWVMDRNKKNEKKNKIKQSLGGIKTQMISDKDKEGTALSKIVGNVGSAALGVSGAAFHGIRALAARKKTENTMSSKKPKKSGIMGGRPPGKTEKKENYSPEPKPQASSVFKKPVRYITSPYGTIGKQARKIKSAKDAPSYTGQNASNILTKVGRNNYYPITRLSGSIIKANEEYSNWREELLIEVDEKDKGKKKIIIDVMKGKNIIKLNPEDKKVNEESAAWQRKAGKNPKGGLNAKGIASYRRENPGSKLSMAVTTPPSKLKPGSKSANRRKSFCARMGGVDGPMKDEKGRPTRKALALRKWNC